MVKITGARRHSRRLQALSGPAALQEVGRAVYAASDMARVEAQLLISEGAVSGKGHVASAPGEPPNWDTGLLAGGITNRKTGPASALTESTAPYAAHLELGTSKMAARPYMEPAAKIVRPRLTLLCTTAINITIRRG